VAVDCGAEWAREAVEVAVARGPHPTAILPDAIALVHEDTDCQVKAGFTEAVHWDEIKLHLPANFKVSPVAVIPQTGRPGRIILNLSFPVRRNPQKGAKRKMGEATQKSVNDTTQKLAPTEPVHEMGKVLPRVFHFMASTPADQEIRLSKVDLSDGFWRLLVEPDQKWNFCCVMPDPPGARVRIVIPSALQMGWAESPAYFCAATETGRDIVELLLREDIDSPEHPLEEFMAPKDTPRTAPPGSAAQTSVGACVNDHVLGVVENADGTLIRRASRATLHAIHSTFPPPEVSGHIGGKDPMSRKKLEKGDARFEVEKEILGFMMNGADRTVRLSDAKATATAEEIATILKKKHVPLKRFRSALGRLQHAARMLPAAKGMFSALNKATRGDPPQVGLGKSSEAQVALTDLKHLLLAPAARPTHVSELVEYEPEIAGTCDAPAAGAGGVWVDTMHSLQHGGSNGPRTWWNCTAQGPSQIQIWRWRQHCSSVWLPSNSAPWSAVTQPSGRTIHQLRAGLPKWQTKLQPRLLASSFGHWPCVNARHILPSPQWPTVQGCITSWQTLRRVRFTDSIMVARKAHRLNPIPIF
jgi:hypothetical protein